MPAHAMALAATRTDDRIDSPSEAAFDLITALAADICGAPIALISLIDRERQWLKACAGASMSEAPRFLSFCNEAMRRNGITVVPDAARDRRFERNPIVVGAPHIRFYAGMALMGRGGFRIGTLCVFDIAPRASLTDYEEGRLGALAVMAEDAIRARFNRNAPSPDHAYDNVHLIE